MKKYILNILAGVVIINTAVAGTDYKVTKNIQVEETCKFRNNELQLDLFGAGGFYQQGNPVWGGGAGINYFFFKYVGLGVEQTIAARENAAEWGTFGNLFLRYPICSWSLAPYATVGIGKLYGTGDSVGVGTVGGGLEYRLTNRMGIFADARWLYAPESKLHDGAVLSRVGVKVAF